MDLGGKGGGKVQRAVVGGGTMIRIGYVKILNKIFMIFILCASLLRPFL